MNIINFNRKNKLSVPIYVEFYVHIAVLYSFLVFKQIINLQYFSTYYQQPKITYAYINVDNMYNKTHFSTDLYQYRQDPRR